MAAPKESAAKAAKVEPQAAPKAAKVDDSHLVEMTKGGETLRVHPSCVAAHQRAGWSGA
jgi:hypothetical protein